jgi:hypothetical protein
MQSSCQPVTHLMHTSLYIRNSRKKSHPYKLHRQGGSNLDERLQADSDELPGKLQSPTSKKATHDEHLLRCTGTTISSHTRPTSVKQLHPATRDLPPTKKGHPPRDRHKPRPRKADAAAKVHPQRCTTHSKTEKSSNRHTHRARDDAEMPGTQRQ